MGSKKSRLDLLVVERGLFETRQQAQTAIMDGAVLVNGEKMTKPGMSVAHDVKVELIGSFLVPKFVGRGGLKLEKALAEFQISVNGRICIDVGASTGGFTDCLLQQGARQVFAVDVGYGQLDWSLRSDARVVVKERVNARHIEPAMLYEQPSADWASFLVADVSFISLSKIFPACVGVIEAGRSELVCLIKPQFEAGRDQVGKGGVVKSPEAHVQAINGVLTAASTCLLQLRGLTYSPITGPAGNIEYLVHLANFGEANVVDVAQVVTTAINVLRPKTDSM
jgi:23S rRNA (cytidine1920-2'-O)/16S rRNA (cytidine1409-2'-O)-methyltransferase